MQQQRIASALSWLRVWRVSVVAVALVCLTMLYSIAPHLSSGSATRVPLDELGRRTVALPPLPLASTLLGSWRLGDDAVGWVRFTDDARRPMEELPGDAARPPPPCKRNTHDGNKTSSSSSSSSPLCVLWRSRTSRDRPRDTAGEGVVAVAPLLLETAPATLLVRLFAQPSRALVEDSVPILCHGAAPPPSSLLSTLTRTNTTTTTTAGEEGKGAAAMHDKTASPRHVPHEPTRGGGAAASVDNDGHVWYAFGHVNGQARQLRSLFPSTSQPGNKLVEKYLTSALNASEAMQLFARVYARQQELRARNDGSRAPSSSSPASRDASDGKKKKEQQKKGGSGDDDDDGDAALSHAAVFAPACFWLCELTWSGSNVDKDGGRDATTLATTRRRATATAAAAAAPHPVSLLAADDSVVVGRAWSTCGDRLVHTSSRRLYDDYVVRVNAVAVVLLLALALPFAVGVGSQYAWMRNSRGRTLRVSLAQVLVVLFWLSLDLGVLSVLWMRAPHARKALALLFAVNFGAVVTLSLLAFMIDVERMRYREGREEASSSVRCLFLLYLVSWVGTSAVELLQRYVLKAWVVGLAAATFWLPQLAHSVVMGSWNGLTVLFLCGSALLAVLPMGLTALLSVSPWSVTSRERVVLCTGAGLVTLQTALLVVFHVTNGRHLLPSWMVPWRHVYRTTCEAQRTTLQENVMCPICRSTLLEGWSSDDELWQTPCHHLFHKSCLERWMSERMECPLCRTLLPEP